MLLSELAQKELIQVEDGIRYGFLADTDMIFNSKTGDIIGFELKKKLGRFSFKNRQDGADEYIPWDEIVLVGEHRILFGKTRSMSELNIDDK